MRTSFFTTAFALSTIAGVLAAPAVNQQEVEKRQFLS